MNPDWRNRYEVAVDAAQQAGQFALRYFDQRHRRRVEGGRQPRHRRRPRGRATAAHDPARQVPRRRLSRRGVRRHARHVRLSLDHRPDRRHAQLRPRHPASGRTLVGLEYKGELIAGVADLPALGQTYRALRGDGAYRDDRRIRVSDVADLRRGAPLLLQHLAGSRRPASETQFLELVAQTQRQRGFGDFYGFVLVAQGSGELMVEHGVHAWDVAAPAADRRGSRRQLHRLGRQARHRPARRARQQRPAARRGAARSCKAGCIVQQSCMNPHAAHHRMDRRRRRLRPPARSDPAADAARLPRLPHRRGGLGGDPRRCACAARRPSASRRPWASSSACSSRDRPARRYAQRLERGDRLPAHQPADRGQSVLGARPHGAQRRGRTWRHGPPPSCIALLLQEALAIEEEDRAHVPGHRPGRRRPDPARAGRADALQRRRPGDGRLRHRPGRRCSPPPSRASSFHVFADETRPLLQGRPADRLGAAAARHRRHADLRQHGRPGDEGRPRPAGRRRRRPHRRQRRHGQQDRHLRRRPAGQGPRHPVLRRRPVEHVRPDARRPATPSRSSSATRARSRTASAGRPRPTASRSTTPPST